MTDDSQQQKGRDWVIPAVNMAIDGLSMAKEATSGTPANPVFGPAAALLTMIRVGPFPFRDDI